MSVEPERASSGSRLTRSGGLVRNVLSNWIVLACMVPYALFITPIVVRGLEEELYGVWSFLNGLISYSGLLYLGLGAAVIKYTALHRAKNDQAEINRLASVILSIYTVLGLVCLTTLVFVSEPLTRAFAEPLSIGAARATVVTCYLLGFQLLCIFVGSAFAGVLSGHDRFDLVNLVQLVSIGIRFITIPLLIRAGHDPLVTLAALTAAVAAIEATALATIAFTTVPGLALGLTLPRPTELRLLYGFGFQSFLILFSVRIISNTDTTVIGVMLGAASVTFYALPLQLVEYSRDAISGIARVLLPRLTVLVTANDMNGLRRAYLDAIRISMTLTGWLVATMIFLGPAFLSRWVGPEYGPPAQWIIVFLVTAMFAQVMSSQVPLPFYQAMHIVGFPAVVLGVEAAVNLALSVWLATQLGLTGVAVATAIPAVLLSGAVLPVYLCRRLAVPIRTFVGTSVWPGVLTLLVVSLAYWTSAGFVDSRTYAGLITRGLASLPAAALAVWWTYPADELRALQQLPRRFRTR